MDKPVPMPKVDEETAERLRHHIGNPLFAIEVAMALVSGDSAGNIRNSIERIKEVLAQLDK